MPRQYSINTMGNGLTVIILEDHNTDLVGIDIWVKAGSGYETAANNGVSHFIEHLIFGATAKHAAGDLDLEAESLGATLDAHTSKDWAHFNTTVSSRYMDKAIALLGDAITGAQFRDDDVKAERMVILDEIANKLADPNKVCKDYLAGLIYGSHPYSLPVEGAPEMIRKITRQDILDYYHKRYVPANMAVVLAGDVDILRALSQIGQSFQSLNKPAGQDPGIPEITPPTKQVEKSFDGSFSNYYLAMGFLGPLGNEYSDVCATDVLMAYLGFGNKTWLNYELAGKMALATDASGDYLTQKQRGLISLVVATTEANADKAKGAILARIASIRKDGLDDAALSAAKRSILGEWAFDNETPAGRASSGGFYFAVSDAQFSLKYIDGVQAVTNTDIIRVAQKYLDTDKAAIIMVRPSQGGSN